MTAAVLTCHQRRKLLEPNIRQSLRYLALAIIMLAPAALIETYVTPLLAGR